MKKIFVAALTLSLISCGNNSSTSHEGHSHESQKQESHKGHDHDSHKGHDHGSHEGNEQESHKGHDHDSHKGHDHGSHEGNEQDSHKGHDHGSHEGNEQDSHKGHDHDAHKGHDHGSHEGHDHDSHEGHKHMKSEDGKHFGENITKDNSVSVDGAIKTLTDMKAVEATVYDVKIQGKIKEVCQSKGCWLTLEGSGENQIWVKFKDYAFFAPKNSAGAMGTFHGVLSLEEQSVEDLKHFAEDAGKSKEEIAKITAPKKVYSFMVDGFVLD